jgi:hypothetical protein
MFWHFEDISAKRETIRIPTLGMSKISVKYETLLASIGSLSNNDVVVGL